mmetsp:Transcript_37493/g.60436  ORF Transcript_37493/g.60436 Transcript_37493/m.60436 type:complete len:209 (-) Transcript_37493:17-643(-)
MSEAIELTDPDDCALRMPIVDGMRFLSCTSQSDPIVLTELLDKMRFPPIPIGFMGGDDFVISDSRCCRCRSSCTLGPLCSLSESAVGAFTCCPVCLFSRSFSFSRLSCAAFPSEICQASPCPDLATVGPAERARPLASPRAAWGSSRSSASTSVTNVFLTTARILAAVWSTTKRWSALWDEEIYLPRKTGRKIKGENLLCSVYLRKKP